MFHLIKGVNGKADLTSRELEKNFKVAAPQQKSVKANKSAGQEVSTPKRKPVAAKTNVKQKSLRSGYYISIYTFTEQPPEKAQLDNIMLAGYRYRYDDFTRDGKAMKRVLIGPFSNEKKANKELKRVHLKIEKDAYIIDNRY